MQHYYPPVLKCSKIHLIGKSQNKNSNRISHTMAFNFSWHTSGIDDDSPSGNCVKWEQIRPPLTQTTIHPPSDGIVISSGRSIRFSLNWDPQCLRSHPFADALDISNPTDYLLGPIELWVQWNRSKLIVWNKPLWCGNEIPCGCNTGQLIIGWWR